MREQEDPNAEKRVIGVAGMPGAGKSIVVDAARQFGCSVVVMGDEVREETTRRGLKLTPENMGMVMLELREGNPQIVAQRCVPKIRLVNSGKVVVDGVRSLHEVAEFKKRFRGFMLVAVHASPETRFRRLFKRERSDDPKMWETFVERDVRELKVGLGDVIALAEYMIVNEGGREGAQIEAFNILKEAFENAGKGKSQG